MSDQTISLTELEAAINYWRRQCPSRGEECTLSPAVHALAEVYATMIVEQLPEISIKVVSGQVQQLLQTWHRAAPHD